MVVPVKVSAYFAVAKHNRIGAQVTAVLATIPFVSAIFFVDSCSGD